MSWAISRRSPPIWSRPRSAPCRCCCCWSWSSMCGRRACWDGADMLRNRIFRIVVPALLVMVLLPLGVDGYILGLLTLAYYYAVFAMSWDLLFGFAGEVNFGPSFLIGVGAYTAA